MYLHIKRVNVSALKTVLTQKQEKSHRKRFLNNSTELLNFFPIIYDNRLVKLNDNNKTNLFLSYMRFPLRRNTTRAANEVAKRFVPVKTKYIFLRKCVTRNRLKVAIKVMSSF